MNVDDEVRYRAVQSRDPRFDGKFFTGVVTTGVYCRPVCPAKTPNRENVRFFSCAAAAEQAGFRPCRRCRPETAPGTPVWNGTMTSVARGARLIDEGFLAERSMEELAATLGMGPRHLRRLFVTHLGVAPKTLDVRRKAHFAALLLSDTSLPIASVAFESGFRSIRQFNEAFRKSFGIAPSEIRRGTRGKSTRGDSSTLLKLAYRPPFDWKGQLSFLAKRAVRGVETVDGSTYRRSYSIASRGGTHGEERNTQEVSGILEITDCPKEHSLAVRVSGPPSRLAEIASRVRRMFDLVADPLVIAEHLRADSLIGSLADRFPGQRIPGVWDPFEAAVRAVVGQQITVRGAIELLGEIVALCGRKLASGDSEIGALFPTAKDVEAADLSTLKMPASRKQALKAVARAWLDGSIKNLNYRDAGELVESLQAIPGIGAWSAEYIALRGFLEPNAFPGSDVGIRAALGRLEKLSGQMTTKAALTKADEWRPWRGYAALLLWRSLAAEYEEKR